MGRALRQTIGGVIYHVINRANGRVTLFRKDKDYEAFEEILEQAKEKHPIRILSFTIMPNHWHMVLQPFNNGDLSKFLAWLTLTHAQRWHEHYHKVGYGHLYQGRFKSFPVEKDEYFIQLCRYVERNPLRAGLVDRAEYWRWGSLWIREKGTEEQKKLLSPWPISPDKNYLKLVNDKEDKDLIKNIRHSVQRGRPLGSASWTTLMAEKLGLNLTLKSRGRPKKGS
jgi:putative transposase